MSRTVNCALIPQTNSRGMDLPSPTGVVSPAEQLTAFFSKENLPVEERDCYNDQQIHQIASLLRRIEKSWSKVPRTYIVLRMIGRLDLLNDLIALGFTDHWFPVDVRSLPDILSPSVRSQIAQNQRLILTKSVNFEKGKHGTHCHFGRGEPLPFIIEHKLGSGGFSQVNQVISLFSYREYALKRIRRRPVFGGRNLELTKSFIDEMQIIKKLKHHHIVEFVGSYTDSQYLGLLISPVADTDLGRLLEEITITGIDRKRLDIRTYFGCLAAALQYLHDQSIRHKDIKPQNILIDKGNVLLTDFGLSLDFSNLDDSITSGPSAKTPRYCAPEVAAWDSRNTTADVWSLGCVYLEIVAVLKGKSLQFVKDFFQEHGSKEPYYHCNAGATVELLAILEECGSPVDSKPLVWIKKMLSITRDDRPTAASLFNMIATPDQDEDLVSTFCGICCLEPDDSTCSESIEDTTASESLHQNYLDAVTSYKRASVDNPVMDRRVNSEPQEESPVARNLDRAGKTSPSTTPPVQIVINSSSSSHEPYSDSESFDTPLLTNTTSNTTRGSSQDRLTPSVETSPVPAYKAPYPTPSPPFLARAVFEYISDHKDDLVFPIGQIIRVTAAEDAEWYYGEYTDYFGSKKEGIFPRSFVERYEPPAPPAPPAPPTANEPPQKPIFKPAPATVSEKRASSSFRERIAAFSKPAPSPVTPFKSGDVDAQPVPSNLKERIARLQKEQLEQARRHAETKQRIAKDGKGVVQKEAPYGQRGEEQEEEIDPEIRRRMELRERMAKMSGGMFDQPRPSSLKERIARLQKEQLEQSRRHTEAKQRKDKYDKDAAQREEEGEDIDPEIRRRMELRERMARMGGSMFDHQPNQPV